MRKYLFAVALAMGVSTIGFAQHADIEFGYDDLANPTAFVIEQDEETADGIQFFEAEFEEDVFTPGQFSTEDPGFMTVNTPTEVLTVNPNDQVFVNVLDASTNSAFGEGFVNFYDPNTDDLSAAGRLLVSDQESGTADVLLDGASVTSPGGNNPQFLDVGNDDPNDLGGIHTHLDFDILDDATAPVGAYGVLIELQTDLADADGNVDGVIDFSSAPIWIVFNFGLDEDVFENQALAAFGVGVEAIPEPTSGVLLVAASGAILSRRRRRL